MSNGFKEIHEIAQSRGQPIVHVTDFKTSLSKMAQPDWNVLAETRRRLEIVPETIPHEKEKQTFVSTTSSDELERQGKVRQVGTTGKDVFYEKI